MKNNRIYHIDGFRGIAILMVVFYHAYSRWYQIEPFAHNNTLVNFFNFGALGVQLFFAISGYVIYMSILRSRNIFEFAKARYLRLAPAMLLGSSLIYLTSEIIYERPGGSVNLIDFLPSLTFIDPLLISKISSLEVKSLDGAFWSLYVEVKFYLSVGIFFFVFRDKTLKFLLILYFSWLLIGFFLLIKNDLPFIKLIFNILTNSGVRWYGWFLLGVYAYKYENNKSLNNLIGMFFLALFASITTKLGNLNYTIGAFLIAILFILPIWSENSKIIFSNKFFLFFGFISYPLFLIHQNIITGLAIKYYKFKQDLPSFIYPILPFIIVIIISYFIARSEPYIKQKLKKIIS